MFINSENDFVNGVPANFGIDIFYKRKIESTILKFVKIKFIILKEYCVLHCISSSFEIVILALRPLATPTFLSLLHGHGFYPLNYDSTSNLSIFEISCQVSDFKHNIYILKFVINM